MKRPLWLTIILWSLFVTVGLMLRLAHLTDPPGDDIVNFEVTAGIARQGANIYVEQFFYNYSPLIAQIVRFVPEPFTVSLRLLLSISDLLVAIMICLLASPGGRLPAFAAYWCNPAIILIASNSGQFETLALLPFLAAILLARLRKNSVAVWTLCVLSIMVKHVVVFQVWALFVALWGWRRATLRMVAALAIFAISFAPYLPDGYARIIERVLLYSSWTGRYGLGFILPESVNAILLYGVLLLLPVVGIRLRYTLDEILSLSFLGFPVFTHGMTQKLLIPTLAWLSIKPGTAWFVITLGAALTMILPAALWGASMGIAWIASIVAFVLILRAAQLRKR